MNKRRKSKTNSIGLKFIKRDMLPHLKTFEVFDFK